MEIMSKLVNVVLFGLTGSGKSTVANMLYNGDIKNENTFKIDDTVEGVTNQISYVNNGKFGVFDMMGVDEGSPRTNVTIRRIREYFSQLDISLNYICYVHKKGRINENDCEKFKEFEDTFKDGKKNIIIIITHCDQKWINDKNLKAIKGKFGNYPVIGVDFPYDNMDEEEREKRVQSLSHLQNNFKSLNYKGISTEVLNSSDVLEEQIENVVGFVPIVNVPYQILSSGIYYMKGKPKFSKKRLDKAAVNALLHIAVPAATVGMVEVGVGVVTTGAAIASAMNPSSFI
ncbi:11712_t:CDS:1, partial [Dentiscutata erythropus]